MFFESKKCNHTHSSVFPLGIFGDVVFSNGAVLDASTWKDISRSWCADSTSREVVFIFNVHNVFVISAKMNGKCHARKSELVVWLARENEEQLHLEDTWFVTTLRISNRDGPAR